MLSDKDQWFESFINSGRVNLILEESERIRLYKSRVSEPSILFDSEGPNNTTSSPREREYALGRVDAQPFYILDNIAALTDQPIYDIGCGMNIFKGFYNVTGIDWLHPNADLNLYVDDQYMLEHASSLENAISINSMHFCNVSGLSNIMVRFFNMIKPGGYGYMAIDSYQIVLYTQMSENIDESVIIDNIRDIFNNITNGNPDLGEVMYFKDLIDTLPDESVNGNMRILLKRHQ